jgi:hypothetical protein
MRVEPDHHRDLEFTGHQQQTKLLLKLEEDGDIEQHIAHVTMIRLGK